MYIPKKICIGSKEYTVRKKSWYFHKSLGGQINYADLNVDLRRGMDALSTEDCFFHEIAHGLCKELEYNYPQITKFRSDEAFIQELGLMLRKTFIDLLKKQPHSRM